MAYAIYYLIRFVKPALQGSFCRWQIALEHYKQCKKKNQTQEALKM